MLPRLTSGPKCFTNHACDAFVGASQFRHGRFNPWGATIAVYFLVTGITGLSILGISTFVQDLFYGGALVIALWSARSAMATPT